METENQITEGRDHQAAVMQHVVVVGKHDYILENTQRILREAGFSTSGSTEVSIVLRELESATPAVLLIGGGVHPNDRLALLAFAHTRKASMKVVEHFGGPATIVPEVKAALGL
jgi:DNA-binding NtrC family response regulator